MKVEITVNETIPSTQDDLIKEIERNRLKDELKNEYAHYYNNNVLIMSKVEEEFKKYLQEQEQQQSLRSNDPKEITEAEIRTITKDSKEIKVKVYTLDSKIFEKCNSIMELIKVKEDFHRIKLEQEGNTFVELEKIEITYQEIYSADFEIILRYLILKQDPQFEEKHRDTDFDITTIGMNERNAGAILNLIQFLNYDELDIFNNKIEDKTDITINEEPEQEPIPIEE